MMFDDVTQNLQQRGYTVRTFPDAQSAAGYLDAAIDGVSVGFGGSATLDALQLYERLGKHNQVAWHWKQDPDTAREQAMKTEIYLTSANALAVTGEIVNIDGTGNRVAGTLFGHRKVFFVIGRNKIAPSYEEAVWRARNVAAPKRAQQMNRKMPCALKAERCFDCKSPERICRGLVTLWGPMLGMQAEVLLIDQDLGL